MSRLTELISHIKNKDPQIGVELEREFKVHASRLAFGLNFERHRPEVVELPQRIVRRGDKVRKLSPRGKKIKSDPRIWIVKKISEVKKRKVAQIEIVENKEIVSEEIPLDDLVVIAEFRDYLYPGLVSTGKVEKGKDKPFHTVINGENYHVLKALTYSHRGKVDAIYIDPPYNTGAKDWKYNNDYVEKDDLYRHSKWLAFIERRLLLAKQLLNPEDSVLIVTIDQVEVSRLHLLLEQTFPEARMEMVTSVINPRGKYRANNFARCEEYIFFLAFGNAQVQGEVDEDYSEGASIPWRTFRRSDIASKRGTPKGGTAQFYPIYISEEGKIKEIGEALPHNVPRTKAPKRSGCTAVFPMRDDGTEMNWGLTIPAAKSLLKKGYLRVGRHTPKKPQAWEVSYLTSGRIEDIEEGRAEVTGRNKDGSVIASYVTHKVKMPVTTWSRQSHNAETCGTELLKSLLGKKLFDYPKSLYAVEDALRIFIKNKPDALVVDFFSGSGTTAHAVMRLNKQDEGRRQCICVTNNEVGAEEQKALIKKNLRPGDDDWEKWGICNYITKPRVEAAITGKTPAGKKIIGNYEYTDNFPMSDGLKENAEFFDLTYETSISVSHNLAFKRIAPLLWMKAGSQGKRIDSIPKFGFEVVDSYGILIDLDKATEFCKEIRKTDSIRVAYIVTNDDRRFQIIIKRLPNSVEPVRLYESYLKNFEITGGE